MFPTSINNLKQLQVIFDSAPDMTFLIKVCENGTFRYESANEAAIKRLRLPKDFIGKTIHEMMPKEVADIIVKKYRKTISVKQEITYVAPFIDFRGIERWYESKVNPLLNEVGECERIIVVSRDITKHKEHSKEHRRAKKELEMIFNHVADALFTFDENGKYLKTNPGFTDLFGWTGEEISQNSDISILPKDKKEEFNNVLQTLKQGHVVENLVFECVTKTGRDLSVLASYSPVIENNKLIWGIASYKDITEQLRMTNLLKESERRFRHIAENCSDLIRLVNRDGIVLFASPSHERVLGLPGEFYLNKSFLTFSHPEDMNKIEENLNRIIKTKEPQSLEFRRFNHIGEVIWIDSIGTPVLDVDGNVEQILFMSRDVRKRKKQETELKHLAFHDSLTNLPKRRLFDAELSIAMKDSIRRKKLIAIFILDCDHFKSVNDTYGHDVGDRVIQLFADRIKQSLRDRDIASRLGGDEFQILLTDIEFKDDAILIAKRILNKMENLFFINEHQLKLTTSIGIAFYHGEDKTSESILEEADSAMYVAKSGGGNAFRVYKDLDK